MNYYRVGPTDVERIDPTPPQTIHPADWTFIRDHITDNVGSATTTDANEYTEIKTEQVKSENRGRDVRYIKFEKPVIEILTTGILLCNDFKIESLTGDIPPVILLVSTPLCKLVHALVSALAQATVSDLESVIAFMALISKQGMMPINA